MKIKIVFIVSLLVLVLGWQATVVLADNGPHGGYTPTSDACAGCHRAHTALGPRLLFDTVPSLCFTCHGSTGTGADTNVVDGIYLNRDLVAEAPAEGGAITATRSLKGGGFVNALMDTNWDGVATLVPATSSHLNDGSTGMVWGYGVTGSVAVGLAGFKLSCVTCHDPHGNASVGNAATYRLLRGLIPITGSVAVTVTDETPKFYTLVDVAGLKANNQYFGEGYTGWPGGTYGWMDTPERQISIWCIQCHTRYLAPGNSAVTNSGDPVFTFRHRAGGRPSTCTACHDMPNFPNLLPGATVGVAWNHDMECMTCHVAHGTSAVMGGYSGNDNWPDGATTPNGNARSSLLRVDNRGTCQLCHGK